MAIARQVLLEGLRTARFHVQLEVARMDDVGTGAVRIAGRVARVFRGSLASGDEIVFDLSLETGSWSREALSRARFVEVFLNGTPPRCEPVFRAVALLPAPTDEPQLAMPFEHDEQGTPWWRKVMAGLGKG